MADERRDVSPDDPDVVGMAPETQAGDASDARSRPLQTTFGTAIGAAMLGFEQALRSEPPAEVMAAEHAPELGRCGEDGAVLVVFPDEL
jgi:hypothetical protein